MQPFLEFSLEDIPHFGYKSYRLKQLDSDKLRRHILECIGIYVSLFTFNYKHDESIEYKIEAAKSKIFLSTVRDIAADSLLEEQSDSVFSVRSEAIHHLLQRGILFGKRKLQVESDDGNWLPLHWAGLVEGISAVDIRLLLGEVSKTDPGDKASAMHYAVASSRPNFPVIKVMSTPCSFLRADCFEKLPIHWAAAMSRDTEVLRYLVEKCPASVGKCDKNHQTPLQHLISRNAFKTQLSMITYAADYESKHLLLENDVEDTALHTICEQEMDIKKFPIFLKLLQIFPGCVKTRDFKGALPLHYAVSEDSCWTAGVVPMLLDAYKEGAAVVDNKGWLPLHHLFDGEAASLARLNTLLQAYPDGLTTKTATGQSLFRLVVDEDCNCCEDNLLVKFLHKSDPTAAQTTDGLGNLPLHVVCEYGSMLRMVQAVYECYPEAINKRNSSGWTPLCCFLQRDDYGDWAPGNTDEENILRFLLRHSILPDVRKYLNPPDELQFDANPVNSHELWPDTSEDLPVFVRRLLLRADPTASPAELREMNYAQRRMAMFLIFSAIPPDPAEQSFVHRFRSLAMDYGPDMNLLKAIVSFL
jgi:hypothetical protein